MWHCRRGGAYATTPAPASRPGPSVAASPAGPAVSPCAAARSLWEDLPDPIFAAIAQQAGCGLVGNLRQACSSWRAAAGRVVQRLAPAAPAPAGALSSAFPNLECLDLSRFTEAPLDADVLGLELTRLPLLTRLSLGSRPRLYGRDVADPPLGFAHASDACLVAVAAAASGAAVALPPPPPLPPDAPGARRRGGVVAARVGVRDLDVSGCTLVSDFGLAALSRAPDLRRLRLRRCATVSDAGLILLAQITGLAELDLSECPRVTDLGLRALAPLPLTALDVSGCLLLRPGCLAGLSHLTGLRRLAAHGLGDGDGGGWLAPDTLRPVTVLTKLTSLSLGTAVPAPVPAAAPNGGGGSGALYTQGAALLASRLPQLRSLALLASLGTAPGGDALLRVLRPLQHLEDLRACASSTPADTPLSELPPALTRLVLDCISWKGGPDVSDLGRCSTGPECNLWGNAGAGASPLLTAPPAPWSMQCHLRRLEVSGVAARATAPAAAAAAAPPPPQPPPPPAAAPAAIGPLEWMRECGSALASLAYVGDWCAAPSFASDLARLTRLEELNVCFNFLRHSRVAALSASCDVLAAAAGGSLPRLTALTVLALTHDSPALTGSPALSGPLGRLVALPRLVRLELGYCFGGQALMAGAVGALTGLTSLVLCTARGDLVADAHLLQLGELSRLLRLAISGPALQGPGVLGPRFTGSGLAPLAQRRKLESLRVSDCFCVGIAGARAVAQPAPPLRLLDLAGCAAVDDSCFCQLRELSLLTGLDVCGCFRLGDATLSSIATGMMRLASLRAAGCPRFTNRGVALLPRLAGTLLALRLGPMPRMSDAGLVSLGQLTCLTRLEIPGCTGITGGGLLALTRLRSLSRLDATGCGIDLAGVLALAPLSGIAEILL